MPTPPIIDPRAITATQDRYLKAVAEHGSNRKAATALGVSESALRGVVNRVRRLLAAPAPARSADAEISVEPAPPDEPIEKLIQRKKERMERARARDAWANLIPVKVKSAGPIALLLVGDPHIDDDGCDIARLESDLTTVGKTKAFFAGHIGDITNNWVGRLKVLYANQSTRFDESLRLMQWMFDLCPNLFTVGGNHDLWEKGMDLLRFIAKQSGVVQEHGVRMNLTWPSGAALRLHVRHDFPGRSQFSDTHGMKRELLWGHRDHILACGHTHVDEFRIEPSLEGDVHVMCRVSGYKLFDDYAKEGNLRSKRMAPSIALILDPAHRTPAERVKQYWDIEEAADILNFKRARAA